MPQINKPSDLNKIWSVNGVNTAPTDVKINNGFVVEIPPYQWFNYIENKQDQAIAHINQMGIPVWDASTEYQAGKSQVQGSDGKIYRAFFTTTNVNPVGDSTGSWFDTNSSGMVVISTTGSSTWTVPPILRSGFKKAKVTATGGGGSGASRNTNTRGSGGGAGGTAIASLDLTGVASVATTVGAGGARRTSQGLAGISGGQTTFGSYLTAESGSGGGAVSGGLGGNATGGQLNPKGGDGSDGTDGDAGGGSGDGGASFWGGGIRSGTGSSGSTSNANPGSGGGGGTLISSPGGNGVIVIEW